VNSARPRFVTKQSYLVNEVNLNKLSDALRSTQWNELSNICDVNEAYNMFSDKFSRIYNECIPCVTKRICLDRPHKPWITKGLIKSIHKKIGSIEIVLKRKLILLF
jgi:hypothetical protein